MQPIGRRTSDPPHCHAQVSRRSATTHHDDGETQRSRRDPTRHARGGGSATTIDPATARRPGREIWCGWSSLGGRCLGTAHCARRPAGSGIFNGPGPEPRRGVARTSHAGDTRRRARAAVDVRVRSGAHAPGFRRASVASSLSGGSQQLVILLI